MHAMQATATLIPRTIWQHTQLIIPQPHAVHMHSKQLYNNISQHNLFLCIIMLTVCGHDHSLLATQFLYKTQIMHIQQLHDSWLHGLTHVVSRVRPLISDTDSPTAAFLKVCYIIGTHSVVSQDSTKQL